MRSPIETASDEPVARAANDDDDVVFVGGPAALPRRGIVDVDAAARRYVGGASVAGTDAGGAPARAALRHVDARSRRRRPRCRRRHGAQQRDGRGVGRRLQRQPHQAVLLQLQQPTSAATAAAASAASAAAANQQQQLRQPKGISWNQMRIAHFFSKAHQNGFRSGLNIKAHYYWE